MNRLARWITDHPKAIVIACLALAGAAGVFLPRVTTAFSMSTLYEYPGNAEVPVLDAYLDEFGDPGRRIAVVVTARDVFDRATLRYIQQVSRRLEREPAFRRVLSLSTLDIPRGAGDEVSTGKLFERLPPDSRGLQRVREVALDSPLLVPQLLSRDGEVAVIAAEMRTPRRQAGIEDLRSAALAAKRATDSVERPAGLTVGIGGNPVIETELRDLIKGEQRRFGKFAALLIVIVLLVVFGSLHGLLLPLSTVVLSVVWTFGLMAICGVPLNLVSSTIPTILLIYGLLDSIFVVTRYYELVEAGHDRREAARLTAAQMGRPCLLTSLTTAVGFGAFSLTSLPIMQHFGIFLALGVLFAYVGSILWLPAVLALVPPPKRGRYSRRVAFRAVQRLLGRFTALATRRSSAVIGVAAVLLVTGATVAALSVRIDFTFLRELPQNAGSMRTNQLIDRKLGGVRNWAVVISGAPKAMYEPKVQRAIDQITSWARTKPFVRHTQSTAELLRSMHKAFNGGDKRFEAIPSSAALNAQYFSLLDAPTRSQYISDDGSRTHLKVVHFDTGSHQALAFYAELQRRVRATLGDFKLAFTGPAPVMYHGQTRVVEQILVSFFLAFALAALLVGIAFRSVRAGLLACLPNLVPPAVCLGIMGAAGITLRIGTSVFLLISTGILFDNTIHIFDTLRQKRKQGLDHQAALEQTIHAMGSPALYTTALIALGFGIFTLSDFSLLSVLGITCVSAVLVGLIADLLVTPALLAKLSRREPVVAAPSVEPHDKPNEPDGPQRLGDALS